MFLLQHSWQRIIKLLFEFLWGGALTISGTLLVPSCASHHKVQSWSPWVLGGSQIIGRKCNTKHLPSRKIIFHTEVSIWPTLNSARVIWGPPAFLRTPGRVLEVWVQGQLYMKQQSVMAEDMASGPRAPGSKAQLHYLLSAGNWPTDLTSTSLGSASLK